MSEQKFKEAKGNLAFSQSMLDRIGAQKMVEQSQSVPPEQLQEAPQNNPQPEQPQEESQDSKIVQMFQTFMQEMRGLFQKDLQEDRKTEDKVDELLAKEKSETD